MRNTFLHIFPDSSKKALSTFMSDEKKHYIHFSGADREK